MAAIIIATARRKIPSRLILSILVMILLFFVVFGYSFLRPITYEQDIDDASPMKYSITCPDPSLHPELEGATLRHIKNCTLYDTGSSKIVNDFFVCVPMVGGGLRYPICIHDPDEDKIISHELYYYGDWEADRIEQVVAALKIDEGFGFIDLGANIGTYSLAAGFMKRHVLAVEPLLANVRRMHASAHLAKTLDRFRFVINPISNHHAMVSMQRQPKNLGMTHINYMAKQTALDQELKLQTITLNDLIPALTFRKAVMKVDIEAHEGAAFTFADKLFDVVDIPVVFMEWEHIKTRHDAAFVLNFFSSRNYIAHGDLGGNGLVTELYASWPHDIIWIERGFLRKVLKIDLPWLDRKPVVPKKNMKKAKGDVSMVSMVKKS